MNTKRVDNVNRTEIMSHQNPMQTSLCKIFDFFFLMSKIYIRYYFYLFKNKRSEKNS